jgi:adenylate cyclase
MSSDRASPISVSGTDQDTTRAKIRSSTTLKHELRTPLNHIIGYCEMLIEEAQDSGPENFISDLDRIHSAGKRLLAVVDTLCDPEMSGKMDEAAIHHEVRTPINQVIGYAEMLQEEAKDLGKDSFIPDLQKVHVAARHLLDLIVRNFASSEVASVSGSEASTFIHPQGFVKVPSAEQAAAVSPQTASLLIVDDNELNRDMLTRRLQRLGYKVSCAENGKEALAKIKDERFDLLLLDILMPVMDGVAVLEYLKADPLLREIPVIVLSASDEINHVVKCIQSGAKDYLTKPFNPVLLQARIGSCLEGKRLRDQEASYLRRIEEEKQRSDELLHVILPRDIATELKATNAVKPQRFENVGILFCDVVGFTAYSDQHPPEEIVSHLQTLVEAFEELCVQHQLEKIKTIGDSFMATAGLLLPLENPALHCVRCGLEMVAVARELPPGWQTRVGIHVGAVVAGIVGRRKYQYDVWGDAVNIAARMQTALVAGSVRVNKGTWNLLAPHCSGHSVGSIDIKGKGRQELIVIERLSE